MQNKDVQDLEQIELSIDRAKYMIEFGDCLTRLENNPDWKKIIGEDFFKENVIRLVKLKASPSMQSEQNQAYIDKQIDAVGHFEQYLMGIKIQSREAKAALERDMQERENILNAEE